jgi:hypothetical protein
MKRLVPMLVFLFFAWGVQASGGNVHYETSGTSDFSVTFKSMAQGFAVLASSNPVTIIAYASTTAVDTMYVEAGNSMFFYCPANHIHIDRTLATAVTINPTFNNTINPNLGMDMGRIMDAVEAPATYTTETYLLTSNNSSTSMPHHVQDTIKASFDVSGYREVYFKVLADSIVADSMQCWFLSANTGSLVSGNAAVFPLDGAVSTGTTAFFPAAYGAAGVGARRFGFVVAPVNKYGAVCPGPYIHILLIPTSHVLRYKNVSIFAIGKR